ncbi:MULTISPECIES: hypothetical protein [unclassified Aurantimonas]|uniref:hypothetical protein n=1 Tax=unclassified Aurantimonas TaxID=2638230 RepID=UPI002E16C147|nr:MULTISPECIES: hypothetical protein [unclassified Aurantimonas]MEC5289433.1 hypothetical protein [Aurantimonas sp. C2-3-R2]MEC5410513.1 hypothetical protein [Aurantimonas sp. C2-4-R8]
MTDRTKTPNDGGPAFPEAVAISPTGYLYQGKDGMTLRDWFAGQALAAQGPGAEYGDKITPEAYAKAAYAIADAMLAERLK